MFNAGYGGIYPLVPAAEERCFHCGYSQPKVDHIIEALNSFIHATCVMAFLETDRGKRLRADGISVALLIDGKMQISEGIE